MDYVKIQKKFPLAFAELIKWRPQLEIRDGKLGCLLQPSPVHAHIWWWDNFNDRDLYDFFDKHEFEIAMIPYYDMKLNKASSFCSTIGGSGVGEYKTRTKAETEAYMKAFSLFEEKLKK